MADVLDAVLGELEDSLTVPQVAALLEVHQATVYRAVKSGRLRSMSRGSGSQRRTLTLVPRSAIAEYLNPVPTPAPDAAPVLAA